MRFFVAMLAVLLAVGPAVAETAELLLGEVLGSWQGDEQVQFVELVIAAEGATDVAGGEITVDGPTGDVAQRRTFVLPTNVANGALGARILIATNRAAQVAGVVPDFTLPVGSVNPDGGRICYQAPHVNSSPVDCIAYGSFTGENGAFGAPSRLTPANRSLEHFQLTGRNRADWRGVLEPTPQRNDGQAGAFTTLCGDGRVDNGEECDGTLLAGKTCADLGYIKGTLRCVQCHFDTSGCNFCGNDQVNGSEQCDGTDLGDRTCATQGFTGGTLGCTRTCRLTTAGCDPTFFLPGGGPAGPECLAEWRLTNAAQKPGADGRVAPRQHCRDGDPGCDADSTPGACTFTLAICFGRDDARLRRGSTSCRRGPIEEWTLLAPKDPTAGPAATLIAAVAATGASSVAGATVTFSAPDATERCTAPFAVTLGTRSKLTLRARATSSAPRLRDVDTLRLACTP